MSPRLSFFRYADRREEDRVDQGKASRSSMRTGGKCLIQRNPSLASPPAAIVTGGAGEGIGHGITAALLDDNWAVLVVDRDPEKCHGLMEQVRSEGKPIEVMVADIRSPDTARHAVEIALRSFGRLD